MTTFLEYAANKEKKLIDTFGKYKVFQVNGENIRRLNKEAHEFSDVGIHKQFPSLIPKDEIWLDDITNERERFFNISFALKFLKTGDYDKAVAYVRKVRERYENVKSHPEKVNEKAPAKVYVSLYGKIKEP